MPCPYCGRTSNNSYYYIGKSNEHKYYYDLCKQCSNSSSIARRCQLCCKKGKVPWEQVEKMQAKAKSRGAPEGYERFPMQYGETVLDGRKLIKWYLRGEGCGAEPREGEHALSLVRLKDQDFIVTHDTTLEGMAHALARGGPDCQSTLIKNCPNVLTNHHDSLLGGGNFVYTRIVSSKGPAASLGLGIAGKPLPVLFVFKKELLFECWREIFGGPTDYYGEVGTVTQRNLKLTGWERGTLALRELVMMLESNAGPTENNEFGFFRRIEFTHLRAIVIKKVGPVQKGRASITGNEGVAVREACAKKLGAVSGRIVPKRKRANQDSYADADATVDAAFASAYGFPLADRFIALPPTLARKDLLKTLLENGM